MANVLNEEKKQQVLALGRLAGRCGASSKRPESVVKRRRVPESGGIAVRPPSGWGGANQNRPTK